LLFSEKELRDHNSRVNFDQSPPLFFYQAHRYFSILNDKSIYEMDPKTLTYTDVSKTLFKGKEAMNVGISEVKYLDRDYGEGFIINNNLSATYYYFPATNRLYTEEAFKYARELTPNQLNGEIRDTTYLELQEENVSETSSKGGMLRLWKIHAKFHLGDPQDFTIGYKKLSPKNVENDLSAPLLSLHGLRALEAKYSIAIQTIYLLLSDPRFLKMQVQYSNCIMLTEIHYGHKH